MELFVTYEVRVLELRSVPCVSSPGFFLRFFFVFMGLEYPGGVCGLLLRDICDAGVDGTLTFLLTTLPRVVLGVAGVVWLLLFSVA